jgi:hypothetical protein
VAGSEGTTRPKKHETTGLDDLFRARLDQIINMKHELAQLAGRAGLALADAFDLGVVEGIQLPAALALLLRANLVGA